MPAWPGGPCPKCGEYMPEHLIHCRTCRELLNEDLKQDSVEIPSFIPMQEIESMIEVHATGFHVECPNCNRELRISRKYAGQRVKCKFCRGQFRLNLSEKSLNVHAFFAQCPHCDEELRASRKYLGAKVACKICGGKIHFPAVLN